MYVYQNNPKLDEMLHNKRMVFCFQVPSAKLRV